MDLGSKPDTSHFYKTKVIMYNADSENLTAKMIVEDMTNYESCPEDNIGNTNRSINTQEIRKLLDSANSLNLNLLDQYTAILECEVTY
ncbi:hypothetical protein F8M41_009320 [Gigaspora margarita]|uniref:Uncharacterized protein n=1 Tax=Gigaspora margarita TaxID=4874 RepID=A0A8H4B4F0_GIGMA|nr:hypothetical protein F8M41_009320 [Gigaspora margarita]